MQAVLGRQGMFVGRDYRNVEVMADLRPVPGSPWFIVAKVDAKEILAEARYRAGAHSPSSSSFLSSFPGWHLPIAIVNGRHPLSDAVPRGTQERESRELFRTTLYSIGDAVITADMRRKGEADEPGGRAAHGLARGRGAGEGHPGRSFTSSTSRPGPKRRIRWSGCFACRYGARAWQTTRCSYRGTEGNTPSPTAAPPSGTGGQLPRSGHWYSAIRPAEGAAEARA